MVVVIFTAAAGHLASAISSSIILPIAFAIFQAIVAFASGATTLVLFDFSWLQHASSHRSC